jgi:predicted signal transduction protein with EAL and GGDEF domain
MSFNLSAHDLSDSETVVQIIAIINRSRVDPKRIDFEITETAVAHDFKQAVAAVQTLKALGAGISLDDFGTGYSSLSHVHRLPLDKIKVDRSFITDIGSNPVSLKIVKSLTALCADMGLDCIIEGVETAAQLATLRDLGCRMVQGYYFAQPMTEAEVPAFLASADEKRA